ncbi:MAG: BrnA antitoxin family protein [Bryobacteraceae bacterium]
MIRLISARKAVARERREYAKSQSAQADEIRTLRRMKEREIDTTDIPPALDWSKAVVGKFYRPKKKPLTIRLDEDVLAWLKGQGDDYRTRINALLRRSMERASADRQSR